MNGRWEQRSVFLTGGTGFVGGFVARRLRAHGHRIRALVRSADKTKSMAELGIDVVLGDITQPRSLDEAVEGCDTVIHLVGIIREDPPATYEAVHIRGTLRVLEAAERCGVKRFVHMSALGAKPDGTVYHRTKYEAEELVRRSSIPGVIFRPSVIVGPGSALMKLLLTMLRISPIVPVIGDGQYRLQPTDVEDVAEAFARAAGRSDSVEGAFEIGGPHKLTYNRLLGIICEEFGWRRRFVHVPVGLVKPFVNLASRWRLPTPIDSQELAMLLEENIIPGDASVLREVFGIEPTTLRSVLQRFPRRHRRHH
ncbi:MAG: NAD(P)H-binding protein [Gemmatimonadales bacterium]|jgi:NADH dehydrogenase